MRSKQIIQSRKLAINGGKKTVTIEPKDRWKLIREEEIKLVTEMLQRDEISTPGTGVMKEFEEDFAKFIGRKYVLSQCNGTSTLDAAFFAVGVGPGDEVIVPSYTWHASVTPVVHNNGIPVFCEIDPHTLLVDPKDIERKITPQTKAICVVHLWGNVCKMDEIMEIAKKYSLSVIEDCSHAHGAEYNGKKVGTIGDIGCFSLQGSKPIVAGEGGVIVTDNLEYYERILIYGHYGRIQRDLITDKYRFLGDMGIGYKFRAHPLAMGIAKVQLTRLEEINQKRSRNVAYLDENLGKIKGIETISTYPLTKRGGFYGYKLIYHPEELDGVPREKFIQALQAEGVPVSTCRYPFLHLSPFFNGFNFNGKGCPFDCPWVKNKRYYRQGSLPITEDVHSRLLDLPVFTEPPTGLLDQFIEAFEKVTQNIDQLK